MGPDNTSPAQNNIHIHKTLSKHTEHEPHQAKGFPFPFDLSVAKLLQSQNSSPKFQNIFYKEVFQVRQVLFCSKSGSNNNNKKKKNHWILEIEMALILQPSDIQVVCQLNSH